MRLLSSYNEFIKESMGDISLGEIRNMRKFGSYNPTCDPKVYEYQYREEIGSYYKRLVGDETWDFTTEEDFNSNATKDNTIEWENKEEK